MRAIDAEALIAKIMNEMRRFNYDETRILTLASVINMVDELPTEDVKPEITRCKGCLYGYLYIDVQNGVTDTWIDCRNPDGLHRDTALDEYCSASTRKKEAEEVKE